MLNYPGKPGQTHGSRHQRFPRARVETPRDHRGRIRAANVETVVRVTGCDQVHASFGEPVPEEPGRGRRGYPVRSRVSAADLSDTRERLDFLAAELPG